MSPPVSPTVMQETTADSLYRVRVTLTSVLAHPTLDAMCISEALYGEIVEVLSYHGDWVAIRQRRDGYEGYVLACHLQAIDPATCLPGTHRVVQRSTLLFQQADIKSPLMHRIPFGAELTLTETVTSSFCKTACGHYVWTAHCLPLTEHYPSGPLELATSLFLGTVYRWGGCTPEGFDCSGLVQVLARSQGFSLPRDSGDQEACLQTNVSAGDYRARDLVFWPGHTGILTSPEEILHATAYFLSCVIEPLENVIERAGPVSSVKRLF